MKNKILLPIILLATLALTGCTFGQQTGSEGSKSEQETSQQESPTPASESESESESQSESESEPPVVYGVAINNKAALQAEWYAGGASRQMDIELTPAGNVALAISKKELVITSSNAEVVSVTGQVLNAVGEGSATITVTYHGESDSVDLEVLHQQTNKEIYGTAHEGTADDPFDNEDAIKAAKKNLDEELGGVFYIRGTVASFYHAPGARTDGLVSYFLEPATAGGAKFEVYKCIGADGSTPLTDDDIWVGGVATAYGSFAVYNGQYETSAATFVSCEGEKPQPRQTIDATFAEVLTANAALADGADSYDYYKFQAYVTAKDGSNYFLTANKGEALVKEKSDASHGERDYYSNAFEIYNASEAVAALCLKNAKVEVTSIIKNYHGQAENLLALTVNDVKVVENGEAWDAPEAEKLNVTQALAKIDAIDISGVTADKTTLYVEDGKLFEVTGIVTKKGTYNDSYGNGDIFIADTAGDVTNTLQVFRMTDKTIFESLVVDQTTVAVTCKLAAYVRVNDGTPSLSARETNANPDVVVVDQGGGQEQTNEYTFKASTLGISADVADSITYTIKDAEAADILSVKFAAGVKVNTQYDEIGLAADATMTIKVLNASYKIGKIVLDNYKYYNDCPMFAGETALDEGGITGVAAGNVNNHNLVTWDNLDGAAYTYKNTYSGNSWIYGVTVTLVENGGQQAEIAQPVGTFAGSATLVDDSSVFVNIALGDELAFVEVGSLAKVQTTYEFNKQTGAVTITDETLGTINAVFDEEARALTQVTLDGAAAAYLKNNGEITLNHVVNFWDCNGTTAELQAQFKRRYMSGSWQVDNSNADRFVSYENGVAGSAMQRRGYSGGAVAVNFASDFETPITVKNVGFWVYNPSASDITLRMWGYKAAGFQSNFETGNVTAVAGQWTYCRMGFTEATIYNFQIADFTNSGVALVFDNISLY